MTILYQGISCINTSSWGKAWRFGFAKAIITTTFSITFIIPIIFLRLIREFDVFKILSRLRSSLLKSGKIPVNKFSLGAFIYFKED